MLLALVQQSCLLSLGVGFEWSWPSFVVAGWLHHSRHHAQFKEGSEGKGRASQGKIFIRKSKSLPDGCLLPVDFHASLVGTVSQAYLLTAEEVLENMSFHFSWLPGRCRQEEKRLDRPYSPLLKIFQWLSAFVLVIKLDLFNVISEGSLCWCPGDGSTSKQTVAFWIIVFDHVSSNRESPSLSSFSFLCTPTSN